MRDPSQVMPVVDCERLTQYPCHVVRRVIGIGLLSSVCKALLL
jgi:hypothetical protein